MEEKTKYLSLLILIIILGAVLRFHDLSNKNLWTDESLSAYYSEKPISTVLASSGPTPPLYYSLLHYWIELFGISEFSLRFLSVFLGIAAIPLLYLITSKLFNKKTAIIASFLFALSPIHLYYSQEARTYSLLFFTTMLSVYFYIKLFDKFEKKNIFGYIISTALMLYSHIYSLFVLLVQNLYIIKKYKSIKNFGKWGLIQLIPFLLFIPWLLKLPAIVGKGNWITKPDLIEVIGAIYKSLAGEVVSFTGIGLFLIMVSFILTPLLYKKENQNIFLLLSLFLFPLVVSIIISFIFVEIFIAKYVFFLSPFLYIIVARSMSSLKLKKLIIFLVIIFMLLSVQIFYTYNTQTKEPWQDVSDFVMSQWKGEKIIIINGYELIPFSYYFDRECFKDEDLYSCSRKKGFLAIDSLERLEEVQDKDMWIILSRIQYNPEGELIERYIEENYTIEISKEFQAYYLSKSVEKLCSSINAQHLLTQKVNKIRVIKLTKKV